MRCGTLTARASSTITWSPKVRLPRAGVTATPASRPRRQGPGAAATRSLSPPATRELRAHGACGATCMCVRAHMHVCVMPGRPAPVVARGHAIAAATRMAGLFAAREGAVDTMHAMTRGPSVGSHRVLKEHVHLGQTAADAVTELFAMRRADTSGARRASLQCLCLLQCFATAVL